MFYFKKIFQINYSPYIELNQGFLKKKNIKNINRGGGHGCRKQQEWLMSIAIHINA